MGYHWHKNKNTYNINICTLDNIQYLTRNYLGFFALQALLIEWQPVYLSIEVLVSQKPWSRTYQLGQAFLDALFKGMIPIS